MDEGAYVFIVGHRQAELDNAVTETGKNIAAVQADVFKPADIDRLYKEVAAERGKVDIVVAGAGIVEIAPMAAATPGYFR